METYLSDLLECHSLSQSFGEHKVLTNVSLCIKTGEVVGLIGPSGSGKTTLLRCLAGMLKPYSGTLLWKSQRILLQDVTQSAEATMSLDDYRQQVGFVFQALNIWPHLSALDNVALPYRLIHKVSRRTADAKAHSWLERLSIGDQANKYPDSMSGGQRQRLALARALIHEPELLFLDEITSSLDPERVWDVLNVIKSIAAKNRALIVVSHEIKFVSQVCDTAVFLDEGRVVESGKASLILTDPQSVRLQQFLQRVAH